MKNRKKMYCKNARRNTGARLRKAACGIWGGRVLLSAALAVLCAALFLPSMQAEAAVKVRHDYDGSGGKVGSS